MFNAQMDNMVRGLRFLWYTEAQDDQKGGISKATNERPEFNYLSKLELTHCVCSPVPHLQQPSAPSTVCYHLNLCALLNELASTCNVHKFPSTKLLVRKKLQDF